MSDKSDYRLWHECPIDRTIIYLPVLDPNHKKSLVKDYINKTLIELNKIQLCSNSVQKSCVICEHAAKLEKEHELKEFKKNKRLKQQREEENLDLPKDFVNHLKKYTKFIVNREVKSKAVSKGEKPKLVFNRSSKKKTKNKDQIEITFDYKDSDKELLHADEFEDDI